MSFHDDPHGVGAQYKGRILTREEWRQISTRSHRGYVCGGCSAQFDEGDKDLFTLVHIVNDPYRVGAQYCDKTFFRAAWAKLAAGLPIGAGNHFCSQCGAEFDFNASKQTLSLLRSDPQYAWAQALRGRSVPIQEWYFALAGKHSLHPGWLCPGCKTEFNSEADDLRLMRTDASQLTARLNQLHTVEDWQRIARNLPTTAQEGQLREEITRLQALKQQDEAQLHQEQQQRRERLEGELTRLVKQSCFDGFIALNLSAADLSTQAGEIVHWRSPALMFRQRMRQGYHYWERETDGSLIVTDQRICLTNSAGQLWWRPMDKVQAVETSYQNGLSLLSIHFKGLKKPTGFYVSDMRVQAAVENQSLMVTFVTQDLVRLIKELSGA